MDGIEHALLYDIRQPYYIPTNCPNNVKQNDIIINKADKGSTIPVQTKLDYIKDGLSHLHVNDPTTYRK